MNSSSGTTAGRGDRPSTRRRFNFPRGSHDRRPWPWLRERLDRMHGTSPRPAPDTDPGGYAEEVLRRAAGPPPAKQVLGWGTPRNIRHTTTRRGRKAKGKPFAASPWADSEGVMAELLRTGERAWHLYGGHGYVHHMEGTADDVRRKRRQKGVTDVVTFADGYTDKLHVFYRDGSPGLMPETIAGLLLGALLDLPAKWPWEPDPDPDREQDSDSVSIPLDGEGTKKVVAGKAFMARRGHRIEEKSRMVFTITARPSATDEEWEADWQQYRRILLAPTEPAAADRAPPVFAAA